MTFRKRQIVDNFVYNHRVDTAQTEDPLKRVRGAMLLTFSGAPSRVLQCCTSELSVAGRDVPESFVGRSSYNTATAVCPPDDEDRFHFHGTRARVGRTAADRLGLESEISLSIVVMVCNCARFVRSVRGDLNLSVFAGMIFKSN